VDKAGSEGSHPYELSNKYTGVDAALIVDEPKITHHFEIGSIEASSQNQM
jgi:hypothetical protein